MIIETEIYTHPKAVIQICIDTKIKGKKNHIVQYKSINNKKFSSIMCWRYCKVLRQYEAKPQLFTKFQANTLFKKMIASLEAPNLKIKKI